MGSIHGAIKGRITNVEFGKMLVEPTSNTTIPPHWVSFISLLEGKDGFYIVDPSDSAFLSCRTKWYDLARDGFDEQEEGLYLTQMSANDLSIVQTTQMQLKNDIENDLLDPTALNCDGKNMLHIAVIHNRVDIVRMMIELTGSINYGKTTRNSRTVMELAQREVDLRRSGSSDIMNLLCEANNTGNDNNQIEVDNNDDCGHDGGMEDDMVEAAVPREWSWPDNISYLQRAKMAQIHCDKKVEELEDNGTTLFTLFWADQPGTIALQNEDYSQLLFDASKMDNCISNLANKTAEDAPTVGTEAVDAVDAEEAEAVNAEEAANAEAAEAVDAEAVEDATSMFYNFIISFFFFILSHNYFSPS